MNSSACLCESRYADFCVYSYHYREQLGLISFKKFPNMGIAYLRIGE